MKPITYNTPIESTGIVSGPEQLFQAAPVQVTDASIFDAVSLLNSRAMGICSLLTTDGGTDEGFMTNHDAVINAIFALAAVLEQQSAVLSHNHHARKALAVK